MLLLREWPMCARHGIHPRGDIVPCASWSCIARGTTSPRMCVHQNHQKRQKRPVDAARRVAPIVYQIFVTAGTDSSDSQCDLIWFKPRTTQSFVCCVFSFVPLLRSGRRSTGRGRHGQDTRAASLPAPARKVSLRLAFPSIFFSRCLFTLYHFCCFFSSLATLSSTLPPLHSAICRGPWPWRLGTFVRTSDI